MGMIDPEERATSRQQDCEPVQDALEQHDDRSFQ